MCQQRADTVLAKLTVDILGPVPLADVEVSATVLRPGRGVELVGAELAVGGTVAVRATGWRLLRTDTSGQVAGAAPPLPPPTLGETRPDAAGWHHEGYLDSVQWSWLEGSWTEPGRAVVWGRPRYDLVAGEPTDGLCRLLTVVDSASGLSSRLDATRWLFPNTDLTVHVHREPEGEWVGVDANTVIGPTGAAVATATIHDLAGPVGHSGQILTVRPR